MFGFMQERHDYKSYIAALDTLLPLILTVAIAPIYSRPFILASSLFSSTVRKGLKAIDHIAQAARDCVAARLKKIDNSLIEEDLLQQLLTVVSEKGEKVDFGISQVQHEAYVAL